MLAVRERQWARWGGRRGAAAPQFVTALLAPPLVPAVAVAGARLFSKCHCRKPSPVGFAASAWWREVGAQTPFAPDR